MTTPTVGVSPISDAQYFDNNGNPLSGGKLFFYVGGSWTSEKTTYSDSLGTIPNANPIVLDSSGRPTVDIWFTLNEAYNIALTQPDDTIVLNSWENIAVLYSEGGGGGGTPAGNSFQVQFNSAGQFAANTNVEIINGKLTTHNEIVVANTVVIGVGANNEIGVNTIAIGSGALAYNVTGNSTIAIGANSANNMSDSNNNIVIGVNSLGTDNPGEPFSTVADNIVIGNNSNRQIYDGATNNVVIGHDLYNEQENIYGNMVLGTKGVTRLRFNQYGAMATNNSETYGTTGQVLVSRGMFQTPEWQTFTTGMSFTTVVSNVTPTRAAFNNYVVEVNNNGVIITLNSGVFQAGDAFIICNLRAAPIFINAGAGYPAFQLLWAGTMTSGNRQLAGQGMATVVFTASYRAYISGAGLT